MYTFIYIYTHRYALDMYDHLYSDMFVCKRMYACAYVSICTYIHICIHVYVSVYVNAMCIHAYVHPHTRMRICIYGQASGVPSPPPPAMVWSGRGGGGGGLPCAEKGGGLELPPAGGVVLGGRPRKPFASHIPYNVARAPVLINLNLYFKPYTQP